MREREGRASEGDRERERDELETTEREEFNKSVDERASTERKAGLNR